MAEELCACELEKYVKDSDLLTFYDIELRVFDTIDSTNSEARRLVSRADFLPDKNYVLIALGQSNGRGRMGRSFFSPSNTGLYLTFLFSADDMDAESILCLTPAAAVAVVRALASEGVDGLGIKWVNDIYRKGKKVCGILAESFCSGDKRYVALGIGVNLYTRDFPNEISNIAASVFEGNAEGSERLGFTSRFAERLIANTCELRKQILARNFEYMKEYRENSIVIGRQVSFIKNGKEEFGKAEEIDDLGRLWVSNPRGDTVVLSGGEISLFIKD